MRINIEIAALLSRRGEAPRWTQERSGPFVLLASRFPGACYIGTVCIDTQTKADNAGYVIWGSRATSIVEVDYLKWYFSRSDGVK